jgi:hypothetical protein
MNLEYERPDVEAIITSSHSRAELEAAFQKIIHLRTEFRRPHIYGRKLYVRWLDKLIPAIASRLGLVDVPQLPKSNERIVVLATILRRTGGHSQIVKDIMRAFPRRVTAIYSDVYRELPEDLPDMPQLATDFGEGAWLYARRRLLIDRAVEIYMMLKAIQPTRIFLFGHLMDPVPILAAWPFREISEFIHHADHAPSIGATLPFSSHVDVTYRCHLTCQKAGLNAVFAGMTAPIPPADPARRRADGELIIGTCGSPNKFHGSGKYTWTDYVVATLRAKPNSRIVHIGPVTPELGSAISIALAKANIDPTRYTITGHVMSLQAELLARGVDVYLSSYPETGGRSNLEAMAAHLPVILPLDVGGPPLIRFDHPLRRWISVDTPSGMAAAIDAALSKADDLREPASVAELRDELGRFDQFLQGTLA